MPEGFSVWCRTHMVRGVRLRLELRVVRLRPRAKLYAFGLEHRAALHPLQPRSPCDRRSAGSRAAVRGLCRGNSCTSGRVGRSKCLRVPGAPPCIPPARFPLLASYGMPLLRACARSHCEISPLSEGCQLSAVACPFSIWRRRCLFWLAQNLSPGAAKGVSRNMPFAGPSMRSTHWA